VENFTVEYNALKGCVSIKSGDLFVSFNPADRSVVTNVDEVLNEDLKALYAELTK